jgi:hypothetical protein
MACGGESPDEESLPVRALSALNNAAFPRRRKHFIVGGAWRSLVVSAVLLGLNPSRSPAAGTWIPLNQTPPESINTMLLLSDGTVMAAGAGSQNGWYRLTPDSTGSYVNGTWSTLSSMHYTRLYFSSDVLADGRVFVAGGEYGTGTNSAEVYDPVTDVWTLAPPPPAGQTLFFDSDSKILPNGNVLISPVGPATSGGTVIYNSASNTWSIGPSLFRGSYQDEASWVKLPDDSILTIDPFGTSSERYIPSLNQWIDDATVPVELYDPFGFELGAAFLLPDGRAFFLGATGNTALYTPSGGTGMGVWQAGPVIPDAQATPDAPAAMMANGKILCAVSPLPTSGVHFPAPTSFYEYDSALNGFTQVGGPIGLTYPTPPYIMRMLDLPDGTVLFSVNDSQLYVYQPDGSPLASGKPTVLNITQNTNGTYHLAGTLLNGISEGAAYGDDAQMGSNYPLVRLTDMLTGAVYYARTFNWSRTSVMTGNQVVTTEFALPPGLFKGNYWLEVIANGIASDPASFSIVPLPLTITLPPSAAESAGLLTDAGNLYLADALPTNLVVSVTSSVPGRLTVPALVIIPAGDVHATFDLTPVDNAIHDGDQLVTVTAGAPGFTNVTASTLIVDDDLPPVIVLQPTNQTLSIGGTASFTVSATGKAPLSYFWFRNGSLIAGATDPTYSTNNVQLPDSGSVFSCLVSNAVSTASSSNATLTVTVNLVQNNGFEAGDFSSWSKSGNSQFTDVVNSSPYVHTGSFGARLGPIGALGFISQTLTTVPGQNYLISFWLFSGGSVPNEFLVVWDGGTIFDEINLPNIGWTNVNLIATAATSSTVLEFGFRNDPNYLGLDDISVSAIALPVFQSVNRFGNSLAFTWSAMVGRTYQLQFSTNLTRTNWVNLGTAMIATNSTVSASDTLGPDPQRFYRVVLLP